jgi:hypothetical protein
MDEARAEYDKNVSAEAEFPPVAAAGALPARCGRHELRDLLDMRGGLLAA